MCVRACVYAPHLYNSLDQSLQEVAAVPSNLAVCCMPQYLKEHYASSVPHYESLRRSLWLKAVEGEWYHSNNRGWGLHPWCVNVLCLVDI